MLVAPAEVLDEVAAEEGEVTLPVVLLLQA